MLTNANLPLKIHRVAVIYLVLVLLVMAVMTLRIDVIRSIAIGALMYVVGMLDFLIMYFSMRRALKDKPEKSLKIMRDSMGVRFILTLIITVMAIKKSFAPWAVLLGLLMIHVVTLLDSVLVSIKFKQ